MNFPSISQMINLKGKTALVTGGAMGIGQSIAERLAEAGAAVMIADINLEAAQKTAALIRSTGGTADVIQADSSRVSEAQRVVQATVERFSSPDILVNNAGIYPFVPMNEMSEEQWDRVLDLNLKGAFFFSQAAAKEMIARGRGGKIINIGSIDSFHPTGFLAHYDASKGGILMLTKSLAVELGPHHINVNVVCPGGTSTPGGAKGNPDKMRLLGLTTAEQMQHYDEDNMQRIPLRRLGVPDDMARVVLFLASDLADFVTGASLIVDGGYLLS